MDSAGTDARPVHDRPRVGAFRRAMRNHPLAVDVAFTVALAALSIPAVVTSHHIRLANGVISVGLLLPLIWRRRHPSAVFAVIASVAFVQWLVDIQGPGDLAILVAFFTVAAYEPRRRTFYAAGVVAIGAVLAAVRWGGPGYSSMLVALVFLAGVGTAAGVLGINIGTRRAYLAALEDRAARLERDRDQQARLAAAAERARIAREMHDVVAHSLSVMIALANGAAFALDTAPEQARVAIEGVAETGRQALGEMRGLLGVLRSDDPRSGDLRPASAARAPQPGIADLDALIGQVRAAGLPVTYNITGGTAGVPAGTQLTIFRLVQEALTNTLKHAGPDASATVTLSRGPSGVDVMVTDTGVGAGSGPAAPGGQGLAGMRERTAVHGGTVSAGPIPSGGWQVAAHISLDPVTA